MATIDEKEVLTLEIQKRTIENDVRMLAIYVIAYNKPEAHLIACSDFRHLKNPYRYNKLARNLHNM